MMKMIEERRNSYGNSGKSQVPCLQQLEEEEEEEREKERKTVRKKESAIDITGFPSMLSQQILKACRKKKEGRR